MIELLGEEEVPEPVIDGRNLTIASARRSVALKDAK